jgi:hypothetical protein
MEIPDTSITTPPIATTFFLCPICDKPFTKGWVLALPSRSLLLTTGEQSRSTSDTRLIAVKPRGAHDLGLARLVTNPKSNVIPVPGAINVFGKGLSVSTMCNNHAESDLREARNQKK